MGLRTEQVAGILDFLVKRLPAYFPARPKPDFLETPDGRVQGLIELQSGTDLYELDCAADGCTLSRLIYQDPAGDGLPFIGGCTMTAPRAVLVPDIVMKFDPGAADVAADVAEGAMPDGDAISGAETSAAGDAEAHDGMCAPAVEICGADAGPLVEVEDEPESIPEVAQFKTDGTHEVQPSEAEPDGGSDETAGDAGAEEDAFDAAEPAEDAGSDEGALDEVEAAEESAPAEDADVVMADDGAADEPPPVGSDNSFVAISAGGLHTCGVMENETVRCWGNNSWQLEDGTMLGKTAFSTPMQGLTNVTAVTTGLYHSCALLTDGTAGCWGGNGYGQLGGGYEAWYDQYTPMSVQGLTDAKAIVAGGWHTCALHGDKTASCWGAGDRGQLGNGTLDWATPAPTSVTGLTNIAALAAGQLHTCALRTDGTIHCWGRNDSGELGDGTTEDKSVPTQVQGITNAVAVAVGGAHTCALLTDKTIWCWGYNQNGQLGDASTVDHHIPAPVQGLEGATALTAGADYTCAVVPGGAAFCWGWNIYGQLGNGTSLGPMGYEFIAIPTAVQDLTDATAIAAGAYHACALLQSGAAFCWGWNTDGQLGNGTFEDSPSPTPVKFAAQ